MLLYVSLVLLLIALIVYVIIESCGFRKVYYNISSEDYHGKPLKIVFLADLHNNNYGNDNDSLIVSIDEFNPDIVIFGGDMVTSGWDISFDFSKTLIFIDKLAKKYPIYYAPGNHEQRFECLKDRFPTEYDVLLNSLKLSGVNFLDNKRIKLNDFGVEIVGLKIPFACFKKINSNKLSTEQIEELIGNVDKNMFSIMIAHNPSFFEEYAKWGANLVLSGHVHGGIVSLPLLGGVIAPGLKFFPKYDAGLFYENQSLMVLTRGIGSHSMPIRIRNKAEIVCINLEGTEE